MQKKLNIGTYDYSKEYVILGISSPLQDYHLAWHINKKLGFNLVKIDDLVYSARKNQQNTFSFFIFEDENHLTTYYLLANHSAGNTLIAESKQCDYLLMIKDNNSDKHTRRVSDEIKKIPNIQILQQVDFGAMKNANTINNIFSDIELHLIQIQSKNKRI